MSFYGKMASAAMAVLIVGGCAAYAAGQGADVLAHTKEVLSETECYILTEHDGKIALYKEGAEEPMTVYSTAIGQINPADALLLRDGIRLKGMSEVLRLLEDLDIE